jgi:hypothetical protein
MLTTNQNTQFYNLKMEVTAPVETLVAIHHTARYHNPEDRHNMIIGKVLTTNQT